MFINILIPSVGLFVDMKPPVAYLGFRKEGEMYTPTDFLCYKYDSNTTLLCIYAPVNVLITLLKMAQYPKYVPTKSCLH